MDGQTDGRTDGRTTAHVQDWGNSCHCSSIVAIMHQSIVTMPPPPGPAVYRGKPGKCAMFLPAVLIGLTKLWPQFTKLWPQYK